MTIQVTPAHWNLDVRPMGGVDRARGKRLQWRVLSDYPFSITGLDGLEAATFSLIIPAGFEFDGAPGSC